MLFFHFEHFDDENHRGKMHDELSHEHVKETSTKSMENTHLTIHLGDRTKP